MKNIIDQILPSTSIENMLAAVEAISQEVNKEDKRIAEEDPLHQEAEKYFGKYYWGLTISECSESEFKLWWAKNKYIPYDSYYYGIAQYVWDKYSEYLTP